MRKKLLTLLLLSISKIGYCNLPNQNIETKLNIMDTEMGKFVYHLSIGGLEIFLEAALVFCIGWLLSYMTFNYQRIGKFIKIATIVACLDMIFSYIWNV